MSDFKEEAEKWAEDILKSDEVRYEIKRMDEDLLKFMMFGGVAEADLVYKYKEFLTEEKLKEMDMILSDEYISFETAKLAKESGVNIETEHSFRVWYGQVKEHHSGIQDWDHWEAHNVEEFFSRPLQSILQKWLREKHRINVFCLPDNYDTDVWFSVIGGYGDPKVKNDGQHRTYEEALEVGLQEALKLIRNERFT